MAGRLSNVATRIMGGNGVVARSVASSLRTRAGMGLPVGKHIVPDKPLHVNDELTWDNGTPFPEPCIDRIADTVGKLHVNDELTWDNGTPFPEPCIDRIADTVGKYEALAWLCGGLSCFVGIGLLAVWNDKASKIPFAGKGSVEILTYYDRMM
uniref:NADH dehydrogenase [ubiquinone] 1 beta subcomplex subunit 8, mitochondrial n=1 Tax=Solanum tuberosum TaxID=4113 RepID=M1A0Y0_SOLTU